MIFDLFNIRPEFYFDSKKNFHSIIGKILGFLSICSISALLFYLLVMFFKKEDVNVITNNISDVYPNLNIRNKPIMFSFTSALGAPIKNSTVNFSPQLWTLIPEKNNGKPVILKISYNICDIDQHFGQYRDLFKNFSGLNNYYCLETNNIESDVFGSFGDLDKGFSYLNLYLNKCTNNSKYNYFNTTCESPTTIDKSLNGIALYLRVVHIDYNVDHENYDSPITPYIKSEAIQVSTSFFPRFFYYFKTVFYSNDDGYFLANWETDKSETFSTYTTTYSLSNPFLVPESFSLFSITFQSGATEFKRSYMKIQNIVADIGGILKGISFICEVIVGFYSKQQIISYYYNLISYKFYEKAVIKDDNIKAKKLKLTFMEMTFAPCLMKNYKKRLLEKTQKLVKKILSQENIIRTITEFESLKIHILGKSGTNEFHKKCLVDFHKLERLIHGRNRIIVQSKDYTDTKNPILPKINGYLTPLK